MGDAGVTHRPLTEPHARSHRVGRHVVARQDDQLFGLFVEHGQLAARDAEERHRALEDDLEQPAQLELPGEVLQRIEERPLLGRAHALRFDQPRTRDRDRRLARSRGGDLHVALLEGACPVPLDDQLADRALAHLERQLEL